MLSTVAVQCSKSVAACCVACNPESASCTEALNSCEKLIGQPEQKHTVGFVEVKAVCGDGRHERDACGESSRQSV